MDGGQESQKVIFAGTDPLQLFALTVQSPDRIQLTAGDAPDQVITGQAVAPVPRQSTAVSQSGRPRGADHGTRSTRILKITLYTDTGGLTGHDRHLTGT